VRSLQPSLVAQRDTGIGRWAIRAAAAVGSAAAFPGTAACRVRARWMIRSRPDDGPVRHAPADGSAIAMAIRKTLSAA
jgi:hypothetical protein